MRLLGRRVATRCGEIDLVFLEREQLVCVEVKTALRARGGAWRPADSWRPAAFARQRAAARELSVRGWGARGRLARLDLIEIWIGPGGTRPELCHHRDLTRIPPRAC